MNILVLLPEGSVRDQFLQPDAMARLAALGELRLNGAGANLAASELRSQLPWAHAVVTGWGSPRVGAEALGHPHPAILAHLGGTIGPVADQATFDAGIRVVSANELFAQSVAEGTLAYMLCALRAIPYWDRQVRAGRWRAQTYESRGLFGRRVGLIGFGAVARNLLPLLKPFGVEVWAEVEYLDAQQCAGYGVRKATLEEILSGCDVISVHNALTEDTHHKLGAAQLGLIRDGALLVNTARGAILDEWALEAELATGRFFAALDVFETEPLRADSPLRAMDNVVLIPHMAGPTGDRYGDIGREIVGELERFAAGQPLRYEIFAQALRTMTTKG